MLAEKNLAPTPPLILRSILYVPGSNQRALEKTDHLNADGYILDLEDAVAPNKKEEARENILKYTQTTQKEHSLLIVRVNGLETPWGEEDLKALAQANVDIILLPKVNTAKRVRKSIDLLERSGLPKKTKIWCMIETPKGVLNAKDIAKAHERVTGFVMGNEDLANELNLRPDPQRSQLLYAMSHCIMVARAYGLHIIDGVYTDIHNEVGLRTTSQQAVDLGFDGKSLIHPKNIDIINESFSPTAEALEEAQQLIQTYENAEQEGTAVILHKGKLVEKLHIRRAQKILALAPYTKK